jgi:hypothetical protein
MSRSIAAAGEACPVTLAKSDVMPKGIRLR